MGADESTAQEGQSSPGNERGGEAGPTATDEFAKQDMP
jgi:hypothetical protein